MGSSYWLIPDILSYQAIECIGIYIQFTTYHLILRPHKLPLWRRRQNLFFLDPACFSKSICCYSICLLFICYSYQRAGAAHHVATVAASVTFGKHGYFAGNLVDTCLSIVHTCILQAVLTNVDHAEAKGVLARILIFICKKNQDSVEGEYTLHLLHIYLFYKSHFFRVTRLGSTYSH